MEIFYENEGNPDVRRDQDYGKRDRVLMIEFESLGPHIPEAGSRTLLSS